MDRAEKKTSGCRHCGVRGHKKAACPELNVLAAAFAATLNLGTLSTKDLADPVDSGGFWVPHSEFTLKKSFGAFECSCGKTWVSAHAFGPSSNYKQGCKMCNVETLPKFMWVNDTAKKDTTIKVLDLTKKPHDYSRCEACRAGGCVAAQKAVLGYGGMY